MLERLIIAKSRRPLLKEKSNDEISAFIEEQMQKRSPFYLQAAHSFTADRLEDKIQIKESVEKFRKQFGI